MNISKVSNISFGSSQVNIISLADSHGDILGIPQVIKTIQENKEDLFEKKKEQSTQNVFSIIGDYFMNPGGKGILTNPRKTVGDVQYNFLTKMIYEIKRNFTTKQKFDTVYTPGNHCFGAGDEWLFDRLYKAPMTSVITNVNLEKSPIINRLTKRCENITTQKIYEIPDSKNPKLKNHVLFLGVTIPSMYYNINNIKHTVFYDQTVKNDASFTKKDLKDTIKLLNKNVKTFKKAHPNGAVVLMAHIGNRLSNIIAEDVKDIDLILNAHDHKDYSSLVGKTQILSHGQNNQFIRSINLMFNDSGKLSCIKSQKYDTTPYITATRKDTYLQQFVKAQLKKDLKPLVYFDKAEKNTKEMIFNNGIRYKNSVLANYITTGIKEAAKVTYPNLDVAGIPSTIIRSGLLSNSMRSTFNNIDLINMFKGVDTNVAGLRIGTISGDELSKLVVENVKNNLKSQTRNALIQWSDIQINRTLIGKIAKDKDNNDYSPALKIRSQKTGEYEPINPKKNYTVLLADKYLIKKTKNIKMPSKIISKFKKIPETYPQLFSEYLDMVHRQVVLTDKVKEKRVI